MLCGLTLQSLFFFLDNAIQSKKRPVVSGSSDECGSLYAVDGFVDSKPVKNFISDQQNHPWFQLMFPEKVNVIRVIVFQKLESGDHELENVGIFVGDQPSAKGKISTNTLCGKVKGYPSDTKKVYQVACAENSRGTYLTVQKLNNSLQVLAISEVIVHVSGSKQPGKLSTITQFKF